MVRGVGGVCDRCMWLGVGWEVLGVTGLQDWVWSLLMLEEHWESGIVGAPVFNPVASYRHLLPNLYLSVADIAHPDLFACGSRSWISLDIARFYEENCQPSSWSAWPAFPKNGNRPPCWGREGSTQFAQGLPDRYDRSTVCRMVSF